MSEQRRFTRIHFEAPVTLSIGDHHQAVGLLDISLKGALVATPAAAPTPPIDSPCILMLDLDNGVSIHMQGHVAHTEDCHIGIQCNGLDLDSATHLRRLVELNLGDTGLLERELGALWEKK
jgi:hypothetical protein